MALKIEARDVSVYFGNAQILHNVNLGIEEKSSNCHHRPSGCGKTTFLRTLNRFKRPISGL